MVDPARPLPVPTPTTAPYWEALAQHRICIQYSPSADQWVFYPRILAPGTLADDLEWREISGRGTLYTFTVAHRAPAPMFAADVPLVLAVVEWDEGPRVSTEIMTDDPSSLRVGMRVRPVFCDVAEQDITLLRYQPDP